MLLWCSLSAFAQDAATTKRIDQFRACNDLPCQLRESIRMAEWYVETDHMDRAQEWLNYAKKLNRGTKRDSTSYFINSLQAETFYYMELHQFGLHEAEKGIETATVLRDSMMLCDAYFFKGIIEIERNQIASAQKALEKSLKLYPSHPKKYLRTLIAKAYIYNNIGQVKLALHELDSAAFYNNKAYKLAKANRNYRGIVNGEQTTGRIFAARSQPDSARFYLECSIETAMKYDLHDVALLNYAYLMQTYVNQPQQVDALYRKGMKLAQFYEINNTYERYFYDTALEVYTKLGDTQEIIALQARIITVNEDTQTRSSRYIQNIIERYMNNENKLLQARINELDQERNIGILQLVAALFGFLVLLFVALFFRRKNRLQSLLLEQKNEISRDLHDDVGSEISSILIHANLLSRMDTHPRQQMLIAKISRSSSEISQRLNAFIWSLNDTQDTTGSFCEYLKQHAVNLTEAGDVALEFRQALHDSNQPLNGYMRKHLLFCVKEALNNALKHAAATRIELKVRTDDKLLQITIADDGNGLRQTNTLGNGLQNIRKRMTLLKGTVTFHSREGLEVLLRMPLRKY